MPPEEERERGQSTGSRLWPTLRWLVLAQAVGTILTNAYFLRFLEPAVSRKVMGMVSVLLGAMALLLDRNPSALRPGNIWLVVRRHAVLVALGAILLLAFGLRYWGAHFGLPQSYVADEYDYVHSYLKMLKRGDLNPHWWIHPSLQAYVNVVTYLIVFFVEVPTGRWQGVQELMEEDFLFWGRFGAGVIPGTLTVLVTFFLGKRVFGTRVGLIAASLMAVFPAAVEVSQYNKPDPLLAFMAPLSLLVTLVYLDRGGTRLALLAGLSVGLTAAAKYNGGFVLFSFLLAVAIRERGRFFARPDLYLGLLGTIGGFVIGCPYFMVELPKFLDAVANAMYNYGYRGWPDAEGSDNWAYHAKYAVTYGAGWAAVIAGLGGLGVALNRLDSRRIVLLSFPVLYYGYYSSQRMNFPGNLVCVYPFLAVLAAFGLEQAVGVLGRAGPFLRRLPVQPVATAVLIAVAVGAPLDTSIAMNVERSRDDTGSLARVWIDGHFAPQTHLAVERQCPALDRGRHRVTIQSRIIDRSVADYREEGVEYLVVSSAQYDRFGPEHRQTRNYYKLFEICREVARFEPIEGRVIGPTIRILRVPTRPEEVEGS
ncbi:MAG TPA: glycosyltransferase family 39 protein [Vicinamibacteria bacterium]|nr:glycosyltransferase family 39 protein [Vicinamibacteria bacterium]